MKKLNLYLLRHGKTLANENKLYCGFTDLPLSEKGREELALLKEKISYPEAGKYFTSGALRANETIGILYGNKEFEEVKGLFEYNFGDFEMKSYEELKDNKDYINWITDESLNFKCPGGESKAEYRKRIKEEFISFIKKIKDDNSVLLISHGGTIGTILEEFYDSSKSFYEWQPSYGRGYKLELEILKSGFKILKVIEI
ncbi:histidine phosphatase family protein [Clostridium sp.]|uniref:histidine phosphatase family protein n=1 Tax=Clostridium sp. TaxID=1506 RepID=UPI001E02D6B0|nr:histidine phosphatase family protein [Clostridium sp.]MBS5939592.1 histidine phosphatase family protein [Clostridium sp.]